MVRKLTVAATLNLPVFVGLEKFKKRTFFANQEVEKQAHPDLSILGGNMGDPFCSNNPRTPSGGGEGLNRGSSFRTAVQRAAENSSLVFEGVPFGGTYLFCLQRAAC